ncbi:heavy-metal-associated domain-containing protein [Roseimaritima sediminicola]|uniref:heavy-metal-associated domain-containing protein n=1 Tax=Roseimaritima sediminicola TaxID=2662066 RepID=UPI00129850B6|nr:heavy metal-associated domain-containing protein [Roseimaritima sediminicola]
MRLAAYIVAILVAAGLIYYVSQRPQGPPVAESSPAEVAVDAADQAMVDQVDGEASAAAGPTQLVTLSVPKMHCAVGCYPTVKETLENEAGVVEVELAEQKEEGVIDNRQVNVKVADGFDPQSAIEALAEAGFGDSSKVN